MKKTVLSAAVALLASLSMAGPLNVGDFAPGLKPAKWVKGDKAENLKDGKVRVVEFWATWCGPCKVSIPHLTELAKKYDGKIQFVGVSVWESKKDASDTSYYPVVDEFVKTMGDKMGYTVAVDGPDDKISNEWMRAAGERGIPAAFVIDGEGRIMWIGHPMDEELPKALDGVLAKTWDYKPIAEKRGKEKAEEIRIQDLQKPITEAYRAKKYAEANDALLKVLKTEPQLAPQLESLRYQILLNLDEAALDAWLKDDSAKGPNAYYSGARDILNDKSPRKVRDYDLALSLAEKLDGLIKNNAAVVNVLADAYAKKLRWDDAIAAQTRAVELTEKGGNAAATDVAKKKLEEFKQKKAGSGL